MFRLFLINVILNLIGLFCNAQDITFSQFNNVPLLTNPSLVGEYQGNGRFIINYRNQWRSITNNSYKTYAFSTDYSFLKEKLSSGLLIYRDVAGEGNMSLSQISLSIASKVKISNDDFLKLGVQGAWSQKKIEMSNLTWNSQFDGNSINPELNSGELFPQDNFNYIDFATGILWTHKMKSKIKFNAGFSVFHVNRPQYNFLANEELLNIRWCGHADISVPITPKQSTFLPSILFMKQGPSNEFNLGALFKYNMGISSRYTSFMKTSNIYIGAFYRLKDAIIWYTCFEFRNHFSVCFTYDINVSNLKVASNARGGLEISLKYIIPEKAFIKLN